MQRAEMPKAVGQLAKSEKTRLPLANHAENGRSSWAENGEGKENTLTSQGLKVVCLCFSELENEWIL